MFHQFITIYQTETNNLLKSDIIFIIIDTIIYYSTFKYVKTI